MTKRTVIAGVQLGTVDQIVVSIDGDCVDLRRHQDANGVGAYMATAQGFAIPRECIGELIRQLEEVQKVLVDA